MISLIKHIFQDLVVLYKNFLHWNISKFFIYLFSLFLWIFISLPFFILIFIVFFVSSLDWQSLISYLISDSSLPIDFMNSFLENPLSLVMVWILFILVIISISFWLSYSRLLIANLNISYLKWKKIPFFKNKYFNLKIVFKYFCILLWSTAYLIIPILIFIVWFLVLYLFFWWYDNVISLLGSTESLKFSLSLLVLFIICFILFIYIAYRLSFSHIILLDKDDDKSSFFYVKKSIEKTKGFKNIFKFLVLSIIFSLTLLPFNILSWIFEHNLEKIKDYTNYKNNMTTGNDYYYEWLKIEFSDYDKQDFEIEYNKNLIFLLFFHVFAFLFINWLFGMLLVSFYKRELKW